MLFPDCFKKSVHGTDHKEESVSYGDLPCVLISLIESYCPASSICSLLSTSQQNSDRWTPEKWKLTFQLHTTSAITPILRRNIEKTTNRWEAYHRINFGEWEKSFVPFCCCQNCKFLSLAGNETQFNVNALMPPLKRAYGELWKIIELSMLGYGDVTSSSGYVIAQQELQQIGGWNMITSGLTVSSKVFRLLLEPFFRKVDEKRVLPKRHAMKICPWKVACLLKESGVHCSRCRLCDKIDVSSKVELGEETWITPCKCCEPVHRKCLEVQLHLNQKLSILVPWRSSSNVRKMWVSYDAPSVIALDRASHHPARVDGSNQFITPKAKCNQCGETYQRSLRLPRSVQEVLFSSLSDPLAIARAFSTFAHFLLCILCIASVDAKCKHESCDNNLSLSEHWMHLQWSHRQWKFIACAWWQLQQSCMLHILFSPRFVAIVDQLWARSVSIFYVKLYIYFVITSIFLAISFIPMITRLCRDNLAALILSDKNLDVLSPVFDILAIGNLFNYAVSSTTVIAIFWRTNYRVYTISNWMGYTTTDTSGGRVDIIPNNLNVNQESRIWNDHPIYHGNWR
jgi:hypothetical protein